MQALLVILTVGIYAFTLKTAYAWSYNILFILLKKPRLWIFTACLLGISNMVLAYFFAWSPRIVTVATLLAVGLSISPPRPKGYSGDWKSDLDDIYKEMGLPRGRRQSIYGLVSFALSSLLTYALLFGEIAKA